jgi:hypothetical protein
MYIEAVDSSQKSVNAHYIWCHIQKDIFMVLTETLIFQINVHILPLSNYVILSVCYLYVKSLSNE